VLRPTFLPLVRSFHGVYPATAPRLKEATVAEEREGLRQNLWKFHRAGDREASGRNFHWVAKNARRDIVEGLASLRNCFLLCRLRLRTSLKPSSWVAADFGVLHRAAGVFAFGTVLNSCRATVYMQYRALNRVFPVRPCRSSACFPPPTAHCTLSPTEAGVYLPISSTSQFTLNSCFSCASVSGNYPVSCWYSDFYLLHVSIQNA
jgi:hypothetical protein